MSQRARLLSSLSPFCVFSTWKVKPSVLAADCSFFLPFHLCSSFRCSRYKFEYPPPQRLPVLSRLTPANHRVLHPPLSPLFPSAPRLYLFNWYLLQHIHFLAIFPHDDWLLHPQHTYRQTPTAAHTRRHSQSIKQMVAFLFSFPITMSGTKFMRDLESLHLALCVHVRVCMLSFWKF